MTMVHPRIDVTPEQIEQYCRKWGIVRLELFGSVLRDDFDALSDIDLLVTFADGIERTVSRYLDMEDELAALVGRKADLNERRLIETSENWIRRKAILSSAQLLYAAA